MSSLDVSIQGAALVHFRYQGKEVLNVPYDTVRVNGTTDVDVARELFLTTHGVTLPATQELPLRYYIGTPGEDYFIRPQNVRARKGYQLVTPKPQRFSPMDRLKTTWGVLLFLAARRTECDQ